MNDYEDKTKRYGYLQWTNARRLCSISAQLSIETEELRRMVDVVIAQQNPTAREQKLQEEIDALSAMVESESSSTNSSLI
jgi:hypothetical protein